MLENGGFLTNGLLGGARDYALQMENISTVLQVNVDQYCNDISDFALIAAT
jgi:hypothetical protein